MAAQAAQAALAVGRGQGWDAAGAININEDAKVFYLYRGVLIVLVVALPHCAEFLDLTLERLLLKDGTIDDGTFDKAVWLMCKAMNHLTSDRNQLNSAYMDDGGYDPAGNNIGFIRSFNDANAKQGDHTVIAKSISRIVIRFLFAFSLNLRGMTNEPVVAADGDVEADDPAAVAAGAAAAENIQRIQQEIVNATQVQRQIEIQLPLIIEELDSQRSAIEQMDDADAKITFVSGQFAPLMEHLRSLGDKFQDKLGEVQQDIQSLLGAPTRGGVAAPVQRILPRTFQNKLNALQTFINRCQRDHIEQLTAEVERCVQDRENQIALSQLLTSAGNTFSGLTPIPGITPGQMMDINPDFVQRLLKKALVLQANISKLLLTPVTIAYKPSIQDFLSSIGLLESARDTGNDDEGINVRLRSILEPVGAQSQCDQTIGSLRNNPGISCYICGGRPTPVGMTMECEHIFCIGLAIEYFGLLRCSGLSAQEKLFLSILYAWAHRCCNRLKSNISFMKVNPNYQAPAPVGRAATQGRNNFFMFHDDNAAKLLGEIFNNVNQHDCARIDKKVNKNRVNKVQFVAAKLPVVSANVLPLVNLANTVFGTVFAASTVLFTAMSCFKNIASLLVIQATSSRGDQNSLTMNAHNMFDGFNSILPGVATEAPAAPAAAGGGSRKNKNKYVGGMDRQPEDDEDTDPTRGEAVEIPNYSEYIKQIVLRPTIEIDELILEEQSLYADRDPHPDPAPTPPQRHEEIVVEQIRIREDGTIDIDQKYSFLFKLTQITHSLNPLCLYDQLLLLENENGQNQQTNINTFGTICDNYIRINNGIAGNYTLNDLSVILLCQMAIYNLDGIGVLPFNNVRTFDVLQYVRDHQGVRELRSFQEATTRIFDLMSRFFIKGQPVDALRFHSGPNPVVTEGIRSAFMKLCLVQVKRYEECMDKISVYDLSRYAFWASITVSEFIHYDLFNFYCPFYQPDITFEETQSGKRNKTADTRLFKTMRFQNYLVDNGYLEFFEFMKSYSEWSSTEERKLYRDNPVSTDQPNSQPEYSPPPVQERGVPPQNLMRQSQYPVAVGGPGGGRRTYADPFLGGRSRKKNKHNTTKKYRTKRRTSIQTRHVKHKYTRNIRTIKRRKNRRNNRSIRK